MTTQIKYLAFKGIEKKEQILFKSFLNLAKNELEFQIVILKDGHDDEPDIIIRDDSYALEQNEQHLDQLPTILVGADVDNEADGYIMRPVQWSDFKQALSQLSIPAVNEQGASDRVLPSDIELAINGGLTDRSVGLHSDDVTSYLDLDPDEDRYELDRMSIDYNSFTNSDYVHVVDDVDQFNKQSGEKSLNEAVVLVSDDESRSSNSVLIIETNEFEAWNFSQSESTSISSISPEGADSQEEVDEDEVILEQKVGLQMQPNEEYWLADNEIIVNHETLFYIKHERSMIYSSKDPGYWADVLREGELSKLPIASDWQPIGSVKTFPLSYLHWVNSLVYEIDELVPELDPDASYILEKWPEFDLIELDNTLLKLCTMLFIRPESVESLITKSGYSKSTVVGLINACHRIGLMKSADQFEQENSVALLANDGVFGKFKDVFR